MFPVHLNILSDLSFQTYLPYEMCLMWSRRLATRTMVTVTQRQSWRLYCSCIHSWLIVCLAPATRSHQPNLPPVLCGCYSALDFLWYFSVSASFSWLCSLMWLIFTACCHYIALVPLTIDLRVYVRECFCIEYPRVDQKIIWQKKKKSFFKLERNLQDT